MNLDSNAKLKQLIEKRRQINDRFFDLVDQAQRGERDIHKIADELKMMAEQTGKRIEEIRTSITQLSDLSDQIEALESTGLEARVKLLEELILKQDTQ